MALLEANNGEIDGYITKPIYDSNISRRHNETVVRPSTGTEFDQILSNLESSGKLIVIQFSFQWCPHTRRISHPLNKIAKKFHGNAVFVQVNMDKLKETAKKHHVLASPTFKFMKNDEILHTIKGANVKSVMQYLQKYA